MLSTRKETLARVRREAPTVVSLLDDLVASQDTVKQYQAAWDELVQLADPYVGAKEASAILGVQGPNLYGMLRSEEAHELFSHLVDECDPVSGWVPVANQTAGGGRQYRLRHIQELAKVKRGANGGRRSKRKQMPVKVDAA